MNSSANVPATHKVRKGIAAVIIKWYHFKEI